MADTNKFKPTPAPGAGTYRHVKGTTWYREKAGLRQPAPKQFGFSTNGAVAGSTNMFKKVK